MIIDFSCPCCKTPLSIERDEVGGQVNCPSCSKLILLPLETTLPRKEKDLPPFQPNESFKTEDLTAAIGKSVEPYRRDLENKADLLNDAVEMVKLRNERIKEVETLMLNTQSELWALEVELDEKVASLEQAQEGEVPAEELEELQGRNQELSDKQERLDSRLHHMVEHTGQLDQNLKIHWGMVKSIVEELDAMEALLTSQATLLDDSNQAQEEATSWLTKLSKQLEWCASKIQEADTIKDDLSQSLEASQQETKAKAEEVQAVEERVKAAETERDSWKQKAEELEATLAKQDLKQAEQEREEWKNKAEELEKKLNAQDKAAKKLNEKLAKTDQLKSKQEQERENAKNFREEMKENMRLLREQLERERKTHQEALAKLETRLQTAYDKKLSGVEKKVASAQKLLTAAETKVKEHQASEKNLTAQQNQIEEALKFLEDHLSEVQIRLETLDMSI